MQVQGGAGTAPPAKRLARDGRAQAEPATKTGAATDDTSSLPYDLASVEETSGPQRAETVLPSRSAAMEQVLQESAEQSDLAADRSAARTKKKKKKKKKKGSSYFDPKDTLILVGGVGGFVAVLALLAWRLPDFRFPLGGLLCVIGFVVYLLGWAALKQLVADEGAFKALLFRFFPPYQWWYVATNWADTRDYVAFFGAGLLIMSLGGAIIKISPTGKKAEASEKAFQKMQQGPPAEAPQPILGGLGGEED
jgi:hypothetical protein